MQAGLKNVEGSRASTRGFGFWRGGARARGSHARGGGYALVHVDRQLRLQDDRRDALRHLAEPLHLKSRGRGERYRRCDGGGEFR